MSCRRSIIENSKRKKTLLLTIIMITKILLMSLMINKKKKLSQFLRLLKRKLNTKSLKSRKDGSCLEFVPSSKNSANVTKKEATTAKTNLV